MALLDQVAVGDRVLLDQREEPVEAGRSAAPAASRSGFGLGPRPQLLGPGAEGRLEEGLLAREVVVEQGFRDADLGRDPGSSKARRSRSRRRRTSTLPAPRRAGRRCAIRLDQVGVGDVGAAEGDEVGFAVLEQFGGGLGVELVVRHVGAGGAAAELGRRRSPPATRATRGSGLPSRGCRRGRARRGDRGRCRRWRRRRCRAASRRASSSPGRSGCRPGRRPRRRPRRRRPRAGSAAGSRASRRTRPRAGWSSRGRTVRAGSCWRSGSRRRRSRWRPWRWRRPADSPRGSPGSPSLSKARGISISFIPSGGERLPPPASPPRALREPRRRGGRGGRSGRCARAAARSGRRGRGRRRPRGARPRPAAPTRSRA